MIKFEHRVDENRCAKIEDDGFGAHLLICHNGFQWAGAPIRDKEVVSAAINVLNQYLKELERTQ